MKGLHHAFFVVLLAVPLSGWGQSGTTDALDSLNERIEELDASPERVEAMLAWVELQTPTQPELAQEMVQRARREAQELEYPTGEAEGYRLEGILYSNQGEYMQALMMYDRALEVYSLEQDSLGLGKVFNNFGTYYYGQGNLLTAQKYYEDAASLLQDQQVPGELGKVYNNLGISKRRQSDFQGALKYYQKALDYQLQAGDVSNLAGIYNNLGVVYRNLRDYDQALAYYQKALAIKQDLGEMRGVSNAYNNIGLLYLEQKDYRKALTALEEALALKRQYSSAADQAQTLQNIGSLYLKMKEYAMAEQYLGTALEMFEQLEDPTDVAAVYISLAQVYRSTGRMNLAQAAIDQSMARLEGKQEYSLQVDALTEQISLDSTQGDVEATFQHFYELRQIQDSLFNAVRLRELARQQSLLGMDEQERENQQLREEKARQAMQLEQKQARNLWLRGVNATFLLGMFFLVGLVLILRRQQRRNNAYNRQLEQKNEEISAQAENLSQANNEINQKTDLIERKNRDITDSLNYASQIQRALLPMEVTLQAYLPDHFIFYQPKDIVSGDFYWFHQADGYLFMAVIDCTGHGVPGAFMSTLGQQALLTAVVQQKLREPAEILDALKVIIRQMLHQDRTQNQDGMDLSLVVIDPERKHLKFAGAKHSLLYVANGTLNQIKGDRMSVGGEHWAVEDKFSQYTIELSPDMAVYMTTDGYKDQFGGPHNKKFLSKRFHKLLREIHELPMQEQHFRVEQTILRWMKEGNQEQVDDMLVWGFRWR